MDFISRFWVKTVRQGDCLVWTAAKDRDGYGLVTLKASKRKTSIGAHRLAWELANARQVPEGLYVLHICDNPSCVEPTHLYVGSQIDNMIDAVARGKRATGIDNYNGKKTHCPSGHEYSPDNILLFNGRWRRCRTCNKIRQRDKRVAA